MGCEGLVFESGKSSENPQEDDAIADKDTFPPVGWPGPSLLETHEWPPPGDDQKHYSPALLQTQPWRRRTANLPPGNPSHRDESTRAHRDGEGGFC